MEAKHLLRFPNKQIRAQVIKAYMERYEIKKAVCFSCGNATRELKAAGVDTLDISPRGDLQALRWFTMGEIKQCWPDYFDATSGHLPVECMQEIANAFKEYFGVLPPEVNLPTGSGETLICLKLAFPAAKINAVYNIDSATQYEADAPLNALVSILAENIIFWHGEEI